MIRLRVVERPGRPDLRGDSTLARARARPPRVRQVGRGPLGATVPRGGLSCALATSGRRRPIHRRRCPRGSVDARGSLRRVPHLPTSRSNWLWRVRMTARRLSSGGHAVDAVIHGRVAAAAHLPVAAAALTALGSHAEPRGVSGSAPRLASAQAECERSRLSVADRTRLVCTARPRPRAVWARAQAGVSPVRDALNAGTPAEGVGER